jgi:RND family efflux transporter MFP subunit
MNTFLSVLKDFARFFSVKTIEGRIKLVILIVLLVAGALYLSPDKAAEEASVPQARAVSVASVSSFSDSVSTQLIGTVSSVDQAIIQSEASGRVTAVEVELGQSVSAGQVIARLENASQYASVLQAEGSYEGALASADISDVSVSNALNSLSNVHNNAYGTYISTYSTLREILQGDLDLLVADPSNTFRAPSMPLQSTYGLIEEVDNQFRQLGVLVSKKLVAESTPDSVTALLTDARTTATIMLSLINGLQFLIDVDELKEAYGPTELAYLSTLNVAQSKVNTVLLSLKTVEVSLAEAKDVLTKSQLGGTQGTVSAANAQIKQALGSLRAAQANYNKTILRSPIAGVVNSIDIQTGDFVSGFQTVAEIANNNALEVTTFVGQSDRALIAVQQEVLIEGNIPGLVGTIAPAVSAATGKIEVKIQSTSPELVNGETVTVTLGDQIDTDFSSTLQVPLTAVKFTADAGSVFSIVDEKLVTQPVEIGSVRDTYIEILSGVTADMEIVVDVRGLSDGERVTIISK